MASLQLSPISTIDVTLKTQNEIGECMTEQINAVLFVNVKRFERDWDWCYARG